MITNHQFTPHAGQTEIHDALWPPLRGMEVMVVAGRRFGKTVLAVNEIIKRAVEFPGSRIWYLAPTGQQAYDIAWRVLLYPRVENNRVYPPYLPPELVRKKSETRHYVELNNGSLIEFKGVREETYLLGAGLAFVVFDEFPTIPFSVWIDTVRPMLTDKNGDALFIGSVPDPKIHNITVPFLEMYEDILFKNLSKKEAVYKKAFNFSTYDNPHINRNRIDREIADLKKRGRERDAERIYRGKYTREFGLVFPLFNYDDHTVEPFDIPGDWVKTMAVDPHPQKPTCALWAAKDNRNHYWIYREREFVDDGRPLTIPECSYEIITAESEAKETVRARLIDPTFAKIRQSIIGSKNILDMFRDYGLLFREANRDFYSFYSEFSDRLVEEPEPTVHFFRTCTTVIRQLKNYMWDTYASVAAREDKGKKDRPKKKDDDSIDNFKYILNANVPYVDMKRIQVHRRKLEAGWKEHKYL